MSRPRIVILLLQKAMTALSTLLFILILTPPVMAQEDPPPGRIQLGATLKFTYTYRERDAKTGVDGISEAGLNWVELDAYGDVGERAGFYIELVGASGIYNDPVADEQKAILLYPGELGAIGVRQARLDFYLGRGADSREPYSRFGLTLGTFMPGWGAYQDRHASDWEFADLPLFYTHPAFHGIGWQNAGLNLTINPLSLLSNIYEGFYRGPEFRLFAVNGYFPGRSANAQPEVAPGVFDHRLGYGVRGDYAVLLPERSGYLLRFFGGLYREEWEEDRSRDGNLGTYQCQAWLAGAELRSSRFRLLFEYTEILIADYQLMVDGSRDDLASVGAHLSAGVFVSRRLETLLRWEWIDPNTRNSSQTVAVSRYDQVTRWTLGLNYHLAPGITLMINYAMPREQGARVNVREEKEGGRYQERDNNYLRVQVQISN